MKNNKTQQESTRKDLFKLRFTNELYSYYRTINYLLHHLFYQLRTDSIDIINKYLTLYQENSEIFINYLEKYNTMVSKNNLPLLIFNNNDIPILVIELKELQYISGVFLENPEKIISEIWSRDESLSKHLYEKFEIVKLQNTIPFYEKNDNESEKEKNSNIFIYFYNQLDYGNKNLLYWYFNKYYHKNIDI